MGAVTFSLDTKLIETVKAVLPLSIFVETGTFKGDTTIACIDYFEQLYTIELSEELYEASKRRFVNAPSVTLYHGDSAIRLLQLRDILQNKSVLYWLDAHWCAATDTAGEKSQCPLLQEINAIAALNSNSLIIIDDARLFLCAPVAPHEISQWPQLHEIIKALFDISSKHRITIVNDCIIYYPAQIEVQINQYAQSVGVDWLIVMDVYVQKLKTHQILEEKESQIRLLSNAVQEHHLAGHEKELEINKITALAANLTSSVKEKEQEIDKLAAITNDLMPSVQEKEHAIGKITALADDLMASVKEKEQAINEKELEIQRLNKHIIEINKDLDKKELVIQGQDKFIKQKHLFKFYLLKIILRTKAPFARFIAAKKIKFKQQFGPFLGVLNQYPPKKMLLSNHYYKKVAINNPLKVSIITPSFRQAEYIERTIKSVLDQDYPSLEYFVQDGGSNDGTIDILQAYSQQLKGWESKPDKGQSHAINLGFAKTSGEIMAWLNSDDIFLPGTLAYVANYFDKHPDVDVIYGDRIIIDENDREIGRWIMPRNDYAVLSWADYIPQETLFWRRSIWDKVGGKIDESFQFAMDWDLLVRFRDAGACINRLPRFLGAFRVHTQQKTSANIDDLGTKDMLRIRVRCIGYEPSGIEIHNNIKKYLWWHFFEHNFRLIHYKR